MVSATTTSTCIFDHREVEAVGCIQLFVKQRYDDLFNAVQDNLHHSNPRFMLPDGSFNSEESFDLITQHDGEHYNTPLRLKQISPMTLLVWLLSWQLVNRRHEGHRFAQAFGRG